MCVYTEISHTEIEIHPYVYPRILMSFWGNGRKDALPPQEPREPRHFTKQFQLTPLALRLKKREVCVLVLPQFQ